MDPALHDSAEGYRWAARWMDGRPGDPWRTPLRAEDNDRPEKRPVGPGRWMQIPCVSCWPEGQVRSRPRQSSPEQAKL